MGGINSTLTSLLQSVSESVRGSYLDNVARRPAKAVLNPLLGAFRPGNIAMFHVGRVGSTVIGNMLSQHPDIYWGRELFQPERALRMPERARHMALMGPDEHAADPSKIIRTDMRLARNRMYGFETKFLDELDLKFTGLDLKEYIELLSSLRFYYYIILSRKNILRRLVSGSVLRQSGRSHLRANEIDQKNTIFVDVDRILIGSGSFNLIEAIELIEDSYRHLSNLLPKDKACLINYEDHIRDDPLAGYKLIMSFLGLEPETPEVRYRKTNPFPLNELIENFDDIEKALSGTPYYWMLSD